MRFAADIWLWGMLGALILAGVLVVQGFRVSKARARFGEEELVSSLLTAKTGLRRALRGVLSCVAVALAFVAAAQPQYGKGTRILPATNLDVVLVLDYSKSMYARDVSPSRIGRAKVEMGRLVRELGGARFAAVAFAGESISFPLTSDGSAIAQFFRGMEPNDLPVGGTAIARALESGRQLLERDPLSKSHERVMILVTDGEDLEGDPVSVAQAAAADGIRIDVVQIGGESPEPIPNVDEHGVMQGMRKDSSGKLMTTQLTAEGQAQLAAVAQQGGGRLVRAAQGEVGLDEMTRSLRKLMSEELSERVETVYADVFHYPLALAVLLLFIESWIGTARRHVQKPLPPKGTSRRRQPKRLRATAALLCLSCLGCERVDQVFTRESPVVGAAIAALRAPDAKKASELLIEYLETGPCESGVIGAGDRARARPDASYDLALAFSALASGEKPPGDPAGQLPKGPAPAAPAPAAPAEQTPTIDCGLRILASVTGNASLPVDLRARAHYLAGNLEMLRAGYEAAVSSYDQALVLTPGVSDKLSKKAPLSSLPIDALGLDVAYNRALALRLQKEQEEQQKKEDEQNSSQDEQEQDDQDQEQENEQQEQDDSSQDEQEQDDSPESDQENQDEPQKDEGEQENQDQGDEQPEESSEDESDQEKPGPSDQGEPQEQEGQPSQVNQPSEARDQRMLDMLEQAPTLQQHDAEKRKNQGVVIGSTMEDK